VVDTKLSLLSFSLSWILSDSIKLLKSTTVAVTRVASGQAVALNLHIISKKMGRSWDVRCRIH